MALTLVVGTNSFVTLTEANDYLEGKLGADSWASLSDTIKKQALITAFRWLVRLGVPTSSTSDNVKSAQIELAWFYYQNYEAYEEREALYAGGVRDFTLSKWKESLEKADVPEYIKDLVGDLIGVGGYFPDFERDLE
jgi:hypothetical protein